MTSVQCSVFSVQESVVFLASNEVLLKLAPLNQKIFNWGKAILERSGPTPYCREALAPALLTPIAAKRQPRCTAFALPEGLERWENFPYKILQTKKEKSV